ncbi:hypothetical protein [Marivita sp. XM-24bin2]|jgi:hypothetical protein|uniref:hypothetical protein n=1 Tax=unclassified Marivita TaxID=2632480 RepID=UPI000D7AF711|nr:hypothetical protein [Marivita sp. XM-24bin2]MCR9108582.1 hypothetical protein [Paracoccaceae bacterium]PWL36121.1 MAG: hypothetical protein DCO97_05795 [Marivita sp. XM-24bin2]
MLEFDGEAFSMEQREKLTYRNRPAMTGVTGIFREEVSEIRVISSYGACVQCQTSDWIKT